MSTITDPATPYMVGADGECPHCGRGVTFQLTHETGRKPPMDTAYVYVGDGLSSVGCTIFASRCPSCQGLVLSGHFRTQRMQPGAFPTFKESTQLLWPPSASRPLPAEVDDEEVRRTWDEALATLGISPQSSAALARRCLQHVLRTKGPGKQDSLKKEIDAANLPSELADALHDLREVGNFAAHPTKDLNTGEIVQVEPGEAEYTLEVLGDVLDHYFVKEKRRAARRAKVEQMKSASRAPKGKP